MISNHLSSSRFILFYPQSESPIDNKSNSATPPNISTAFPPSRYRRSAASSSSPHVADYGGLLTKDVPLAADAQAKLRQVVATWKAAQPKANTDDASGVPSLIECLRLTLPEPLRSGKDEPEKTLKAILDSPEGLALARLLQDSIDAVPTATSLQEVLLSALLLDVDSAGGLERNNLAGYALRQPGNWGYSAAQMVTRFEAHLATRFGDANAKIIAFQLLSVSAPEFLVKDLPSSLVYGSHQWASFSAAVARQEASHPGSTHAKTYAQIMNLDEIAPVSEFEKRQQQLAQMTAVIDWGIANGVIVEKNDDAYTPEEVESALKAMQAQHKTLADSVDALSTPMPTRRELALVELRRVYGVENEAFFEQKLLGNIPPGSPGRKAYSLLDIYMSGDLGNHFWISSDPDFNTVKVNLGFPKLPNIKQQFDESFDKYTQGLKDGFAAQFKYQLSLLALEDRRLIEYGKVTTFNLQTPSANQGPVSTDHKIQAYIGSGAVLIRAERDGKVCHYLYSPAQGRIIKDADPSRPGLQFPGSRLYFSMSLPDSPGGKEPPVTILWQTVGSASPKNDPVDFSAYRIYPSKSLEAGIPGEHPSPPPTFFSPKTDELSAAVGAYFTRGLDEAKATANGSTEQERESARSKAVNAFFLGLIPFYNAVESFINGRPAEGFFNVVLDVFGFFIPGLKGGVQGVKQGVRAGLGTTLNFIKGVGKAGVKALNPLAGIYDVGRGVFKLGKAGFKKISRLGGRGRSFDLPQLGNKGGIAEGLYRPLGANSHAVHVTAVERNGKWYAFDPATQTPYGAPLKGFAQYSSSDFVGQVKQWAMEAVTDVGIGAAVIATQKALQKHYERPAAPDGGVNPGDVEVADLGPVVEPVDPALRVRLDAATRGANELGKLSLQLAPGAVVDIPKWSSEPQQVVNQLEAFLALLEELTIDLAQAYEVFFKPYTHEGSVSQGDGGVADRLNTIEKKIAAIRGALTQVSARHKQAVA
ncbi:hypothetical protein HX792_24810 [Pseudomonas sp. B6002]|uniref:hypothetical protein n=1 Tax=Pseudomonas sp. B6002 TaxID=2726978 RepID=UPI0015A11BC2|nr:hypothetical protein [Pseudomonas sp. B6002]NVZ53583.1 hypothetical protein [Pseudomonas sp. B6002]